MPFWRERASLGPGVFQGGSPGRKGSTISPEPRASSVWDGTAHQPWSGDGRAADASHQQRIESAFWRGSLVELLPGRGFGNFCLGIRHPGRKVRVSFQFAAVPGSLSRPSLPPARREAAEGRSVPGSGAGCRGEGAGEVAGRPRALYGMKWAARRGLRWEPRPRPPDARGPPLARRRHRGGGGQ